MGYIGRMWLACKCCFVGALVKIFGHFCLPYLEKMGNYVEFGVTYNLALRIL